MFPSWSVSVQQCYEIHDQEGSTQPSHPPKLHQFTHSFRGFGRHIWFTSLISKKNFLQWKSCFFWIRDFFFTCPESWGMYSLSWLLNRKFISLFLKVSLKDLLLPAYCFEISRRCIPHPPYNCFNPQRRPCHCSPNWKKWIYGSLQLKSSWNPHNSKRFMIIFLKVPSDRIGPRASFLFWTQFTTVSH